MCLHMHSTRGRVFVVPKEVAFATGSSQFHFLVLFVPPSMPAVDAIPTRPPFHIKVRHAGRHGLE